MNTKHDFMKGLESQLDAWKEDLAALQERSARATGQAKQKLDESIAELKLKWKEGEAKRHEIRDSVDEHWDDLKEDAEQHWQELQQGAKHIIERMKSHLD